MAERDAVLPAAGAGNLVGWGVFTTIGVRAGRPLFLARHLARLRHDAGVARIPFDWAEDELAGAIHQLLTRNAVCDGVARITLTRRGDDRWHCESGSHCLIVAQTRPAPKIDGLTLGVSPFRLARARPLAGIKSTSHLESQLAFMAAQEAGCDEALLLNDLDQICEAARANLFWVCDGILHTPDLACGALPGVARVALLEAAPHLGLKTAESAAGLDDLTGATELLLTSATTGPRGVARLKSATGVVVFASPGPVLLALRDWWNSQ